MKNEKRKTKSEKRKTKSEKRKTKSEKRKAKNENQTNFTLLQICKYVYLFLGSQERVRNSHGERAISVRAIEVLLYNGLNVFRSGKYFRAQENISATNLPKVWHRNCKSV